MTDRDDLYILELALAQRRVDAIPGGYDDVLDEQFLEFGSSGRIWTRAEMLDLLVSEPPNQWVSIEGFEVAVLGPGLVLALYDTVGTDPATGQTVRRHRSSIWIHRANRFRLRFHQGTPAA